MTGTASASGGDGGENYAGTHGTGGNASATAAVNANGGTGSSTANATGGFGSGSETANATATLTNAAAGGTAQATSESQGVSGSVTTSATAPVSGPATFATALTEAGIGCRAYYRTPVHEQPAMRAWGEGLELPGTNEAARTHLAIPISPLLSDEQVEQVVATVRAAG